MRRISLSCHSLPFWIHGLVSAPKHSSEPCIAHSIRTTALCLRLYQARAGVGDRMAMVRK